MKKMCDYSVKTDVKNIYCDLENCKLTIKPTETESLHAKFAEGIKVNVANSGADFVVKQKSRLRERLLRTCPEIEICVPEHLVVNLIITGKRADLSIDGGIYGETSYCADCGNVNMSGISATDVTLRGHANDLKLSDSTVKGKLLANTDAGNFTVENTFAAHVNCRIKCGNAGAANLNCRDSIFELTAGNVNATVLGDESAFDVVINAKCGTCNTESRKIENGLGTFKAYTDCGNINVEFIQPVKYSQPEEEKELWV